MRKKRVLNRLLSSDVTTQLDKEPDQEIDDLTSQQVKLLSERSVRAEKAGDTEKADRLAARAEALRNKARKK
jgi:hypothetical protein